MDLDFDSLILVVMHILSELENPILIIQVKMTIRRCIMFVLMFIMDRYKDKHKGLASK